MDEPISQAFVNAYDQTPRGVFEAPGRVNLIGEHTDYNDGFVLPVAINYFTWVAAGEREDDFVDAIALDEHDANRRPSRVRFQLGSEIEREPKAPWSDYLRGVICELIKAGYPLRGANLLIKGNVPRGAGLSSSASLENALIRALVYIANERIEGVAAAKVGQAAENHYAGCQCGIMDQMASALCEKNTALLLDCRSLATQHIPFPDTLALMVIDSKVKRGLVDSEYNTRRQQCEEAARFFEVPALRDVTPEQLKTHRPQLDPIVYRRARHVVTENQRTLAASRALAAHDIVSLSALMRASHRSMKEDFEITVPPIDSLVDIVDQVVNDRGGVRMTGGGFGGCVIALLPHALVTEVTTAIRANYPEASGLQADIHICQTADGAFSAQGAGQK